ncbi:hypothetical protein B9Z55_010396 [Caenorhabditis nigoni]|uniref:Tetraspanin n=2 Tax=Caenorhabditis nigoni TaxID=1611254 RepID=A0A2G5UFS7_9PELO|nr:hypothetical protein B9Z55_010396 [Caenorhabditis nigoni]
MAEIAFISRILMFCSVLVMLLCSVGLVVWGAFMTDSSYDRKLKDVVFNYNSSQPLADDKFNMRSWIYSSYWSIWGLCVIAAIIAIIGLIAAIMRNKAVIATFLVLLIVFVLIEISGSITIWSKRGSIRRLLYRFANDIYATSSLFDISVIQNIYQCCGVRNGGWTCPNTPPCDTAVFNSVDNAMMIAGIIMIPLLLLQFFIIGFSALVLRIEPRVVKERKREPEKTNTEETWSS